MLTMVCLIPLLLLAQLLLEFDTEMPDSPVTLKRSRDDLDEVLEAYSEKPHPPQKRRRKQKMVSRCILLADRIDHCIPGPAKVVSSMRMYFVF